MQRFIQVVCLGKLFGNAHSDCPSYPSCLSRVSHDAKYLAHVGVHRDLDIVNAIWCGHTESSFEK